MIWLLFVLMLGTMMLGVPILLSIALVGYVGIAAVPDLVLPMFAQKMFAQLDSFTLLALPYFILAGALFSASGMSQQLVNFSRVLVGHFRAGLAHASVVASMVFAGVSGSSTADASAIAAIVIPTMKREGYNPGFAAALIATSGTIGAIIPPSMIMVVYGSIAQVSIGGLFLGLHNLEQRVVLNGVIDGRGGEDGIETADGRGGIVLGKDGPNHGALGNSLAGLRRGWLIFWALGLEVIDAKTQDVAVLNGVGDRVGVQLLLEEVRRGAHRGLGVLDFLQGGIGLEDGRAGEAEELGLGEKLFD